MLPRRIRQDEAENQLNRGALWAITYGDMMSYLMIFFLIMFTMGLGKTRGTPAKKKEFEESLVSIQKIFGGTGSSREFERLTRREREESMVQQIREAVDKEQLSAYAKVEIWDKKLRLILADQILFDSGKAELRGKAINLLESMAEQLKTIPNPVVIEGHTDTVPIKTARFGSNWELSMARAYSVLRFFEARGIPPERLAGIGYGAHRPVADNKEPAGRAKNRRIEIDIIRTE